MSIFNYRCINVLMCKTLCLSLEVFIDRSFNCIIFGKIIALNHLRRGSIIICRLLFLLMDFTWIDHHQLITAYVLAHYIVVMDGGRWSCDRLDRSLRTYSVPTTAFRTIFHLSRSVALLGLNFDHLLSLLLLLLLVCVSAFIKMVGDTCVVFSAICWINILVNRHIFGRDVELWFILLLLILTSR